MANKYFRQRLSPSATTETDLYTVPPANTAILSSLRVTNGNGSRAAITVSQYVSGSATEYYLLRSYNLAPNSTMDVFNGVPCVLEAGDKISVEASVSTVYFHLSYLEVDRN
jgi:hypothetical protein